MLHRAWLLIALMASPHVVAQTTLPAADYSFTNLARVNKLAEQGDIAAQTEYGRRLLFGREIRRNTAEAMSWFGKAAAAGSGDALYELYLCYRDGIGEERDPEKAQKLLKASADTGHARALIETAALAAMQEDADPQSLDASIALLIDYVKQQHPSGQLALARAIIHGRKGRGDYNALQLLGRASTADDVRVAYAVACVFRDGDGPMRPDPQRARQLMARLAEKAFRPAAVDLARMAPDSYRNVARETSIDRIAKNSELIGQSVMVDGRLARVSEDTWTIAINDRSSVRVLPDATELSNIEVGRYARVCGIVEDLGLVRGLVVNVPEPKYVLNYELATPRVVRGSNREKFTVTGQLRNNGRQTIKKAKLEVHVFQPDTDRDETEILTIQDLAPGEFKPFIATFEATSVQENNNITPVRGEVTAKEIEW